MSASRQRHLAAVMFTDIVGYTALMQSDEAAALVARVRHRSALEAATGAHRGRVVQYLGDGSLTVFPSAVEAVLAAVEIQLDLANDPTVPLRIGVHQGDVAFDEQGVYGDAVNVAARVQSLGSACSVLISGKVFDEIKNKPGLPAEPLGEFRLKNVAQPMRVYALAVPGLAIPHDDTHGSGSPAAPASAIAPVVERLRRALGPDYVLGEQVDAGGVGVVFEARDVVLHRRVAVKLMRPEAATPEAAERFLHDARVLAKIRHTNIVPVHRAGSVDGCPYFVMDYIGGESLTALLRQGAHAAPEAIAGAVALLNALAAAHRAGVTHRDVKPSNIFLVGDRIVLTGFGGDPSDPSSRYVAPELAAGGPLTERADVYAVAAVLYEGITGRKWIRYEDLAGVDWSGVPRRVIRPLRRALERQPDLRWPDARSFRRALQASRYRLRRPSVLVQTAVVAAALALGFLLWRRADHAVGTLPVADLAILPFTAIGAGDSLFAAHLVTLTAGYLEAIPPLRLTPIETTHGWWRRADADQRRDERRISRELRARLLTRGTIAPVGDSLRVAVSLVDSLGRRRAAMDFRADARDPDGAARRLAIDLLGEILPSSEIRLSGSPSTDFDALIEFLNGEQARYAGAWSRAAKHYQAALARDSNFAAARWHLVNVWRWMPGRTPPLQPHLEKLAGEAPSRLPPLEQLLVQAQLLPAGESRLQQYRDAVRRYPTSAYAALLYGEEMFHRGPLAGYSTEEAVAPLETAAGLDPSLAPTFELLVWLHTRAGNRAQAEQAVRRLLQTVEPPDDEEDVPYAELLEQAFLERFETEKARARRAQLFGGTDASGRTRLAFSVRAGMAFGLPEVQLELGALVAHQRGLGAAWQANGHVAQALVLAAFGRGGEALAHFDSATELEGTQAYRLMAAQWRVIPQAIGYLAFPASERARGITELRQLSEAPGLATRAAWTLGLERYMMGDTAGAGGWHTRLRDADGDSVAGALSALLDAVRLASSGRVEEAIAASESSLAYDAAQRHGDPFARAVLHLLRGSWLERTGRAEDALRAWRWTENTDIGLWLGDLPQAAEVDWVLAPYASYHSARTALDSGDRRTACAAFARTLRYWSSADTSLQPLRLSAERSRARHCSD